MDFSALAARISGGRLFHSYIITGGGAEERERAARLLAQAAVCSGAGQIPCGHCRDCVKANHGVHPDISFVRREKDAAELTVDAMRIVRSSANVLPNEAARSIYIICDADFMNIPAQNAMLKLLEEPPRYAVFALLAENPQRLLPTVRSRCETVNLLPSAGVPMDEPDAARAVLTAYMRHDGMALMRAVIPLEKAGRTELPCIIDAIRRLAVREASGGSMPAEELKRLTDTLDEAEKLMGVNVSPAHISGLLLASLI